MKVSWFLGLLELLLVGNAVFTVFVYTLLFLNKSQGSSELSLSPAQALRHLLREFFHTLVAVLSYPFGVFSTLSQPSFDVGGGPPVLFVHGYTMNRSNFFLMAWRLRKMGFRNLHAMNVRPMFASLEVMADSLVDTLLDFSKRCGEQKVVIVAHSQGGVVARFALQGYDQIPVAGVITLGAPHHGTQIAALGLGENAKQLKIASPFLTSLKPVDPSVLVSIYSEHDAIVIPTKSAVLGKSIALSNIGHFGMLLGEKTAGIVGECIGEFSSKVSASAVQKEEV